jgi:hypothetical protein
MNIQANVARMSVVRHTVKSGNSSLITVCAFMAFEVYKMIVTTMG